MHINENFTGILLVGGMSRRYGSPKAFAQYKGQAYYEIAYEILLTVCPRVMIVTREELLPKFPNHLEVLVDLPSVKGKGPLAGIYSVMSHVDSEYYVVMPCDLPLMTVKVMNYLIAQHRSKVTVATMNEQIQPLVSVWDSEMKPQISKSLQNNQLSMKETFNKTLVNFVSVDHLHSNRPVFMNINTQDQERELRKWTQSSMHSEDL